jgi:epoxide hydrolase
VTPFEIHVADEVLEDLWRRLRQTRLPDQIPGSGHALGMDTAYLGRIIEYGAAPTTGVERSSG